MPQPIDMQTELGRAALVDRIQEAAARAAQLTAQRAQAEAAQRAVEESQVHDTKETEGSEVDADGKSGSHPDRKKQRREEKPDAERPRSKGDDHAFDVSV
jgi:hypothetical protein